MKKYDVSIIIPVYNVEKYIGKCLDSLVNQTLEDIEIIVVNDGSPDNSQEIIDDYVRKYPDKVKSYIKENGGQGSARNFGLTKASGEYIGYVDSDDYVELDMYEKLYNKAKKDSLDIVICGSYNVYENGNKNIELERDFFEDGKTNAFFGRMAVWNKIYKRKLLVASKFEFRSKVWYEDLDFTVKMLLKAKKIGYINEPLYDYLIREGSTMNNTNVTRNLEILLSFDELLKYFNDNKFEKFYSEIEYLAIYHIFISSITRVIRIDSSDSKKEVINELRNYVIEKFPKYNKNKYLILLDRNKKIVYNLIRLKQYWIIKLIFKFKDLKK